jgi:hypothetical protein
MKLNEEKGDDIFYSNVDQSTFANLSFYSQPFNSNHTSQTLSPSPTGSPKRAIFQRCSLFHLELSYFIYNFEIMSYLEQNKSTTPIQIW